MQFKTIEDRNLVISYATNLGGSDGNVEIVIPDRLQTLQKRLEHYAYRYRKESRELAAGKKELVAKTQLRLDNMSDTLLLGIRESRDAEWTFYKQKDLPKLQDDDSSDTDAEESEVEVVEDEY